MKTTPQTIPDTETIDAEIRRLMEQRARLVSGRTDLKPREMLLDSGAKERILHDIDSLCRQLTAPRRAAFLGPMYSYTQLAMTRYFGAGIDIAPVSTISNVFEEVEAGTSDFGVVPIENSTDGRVVDALEQFTHTTVKICGQISIPIHHTLMARCGRAEIREVRSKPQAFSQCRHWLASHLPGVPLVECTSTSEAAKSAQSEPGVAAVASPLAAVAYGLNILVEGIEDNPQNVTRFVVLGKSDAPKSKGCQTTLLFELAHQPGSLADAMAVFKRSHVNLTWIESFPNVQTPGTYYFFVDFPGHREELKVRRLLESLEKKVCRLVVLGSYLQTPS